MRAQNLPSFKDMPPIPGMPQGTAWGLFDQNGERDNCGTLNLLTPENTLEACKEIKSGRSVALNWAIDRIHEPGFNREKPQHTIRDLTPLGFKAYDDVIHINTQSGSQWDGFRHWAHQPTSLYYNNFPHSDVTSLLPENICKNGIDVWTARGGIVGRGVLIDYTAYAAHHNIAYSPITRHEISIETIEEIAKEQGVIFKEADILIIRSGFVKWYEKASAEERIQGAKNNHEYIGVKSCRETVEWIWNRHFAAVAGDAVAWECWPSKDGEWRLHDWLLGLFGCPIGELWNLEELAKVCAEQKQYSFFLTSAPLNVPGGVASPPNAVAVF
ncbi:hypothetical protein MFRU_049g00530 [Monilinia fructicola]|nr:hypothetical protein MFRU_049g00530 [Monilinia fructicola]